MIFEKDLINDNYKIRFSPDTTEDGRLVSQSLIVDSLKNKRDTISYNFYRPAEFKKGLTLYHVTFKDKLEGILKDGLVPTCGYGYKNHWLSFFWDDEITEKLYPGVFLKAGEPINGFGFNEDYPCFAVNIDDLDPDYLFIDDSIDDSYIYTKTIRPDQFLHLTL